MEQPRPIPSDGPERRKELLEKVESLISVLDLAHKKVLRNLAAPGADRRRLEQVRRNLEGTLLVCQRARRVLQEQVTAEGGTGGAVAPAGGDAAAATDQPMTLGEYLECGTVGEYQRLRCLGPIRREEISRVVLDSLCRRLASLEP